MTTRTGGIEEEFLLVDAATGRPQAMAGAVMRAATAAAGGAGAEPGYLEFELQKQQVEINTSPCVSLADPVREVTRCRAMAADAAARAGASVAALGTSPVPVESAITGQGRYRRMAEHFGGHARDRPPGSDRPGPTPRRSGR